MISFDSTDFAEACRIHKVKTLVVFGSALSDKFTESSDIDLVVDFNDIPIENYADNYFDLKYSLQTIFKRQIDLLENNAIKNPYFKKEILTTGKLVYG